MTRPPSAGSLRDSERCQSGLDAGPPYPSGLFKQLIEPAVEWLEPLDWIEPNALPPEIDEISAGGRAAWTRLLARLRSETSPDSSA